MYYVDILKSLTTNSYYIDSTNDLADRLKWHNDSRARSTKTGIPWKLVYHEAFKTRSQAVK